MGRNNQQRRQAKAKERAKAGARARAAAQQRPSQREGQGEGSAFAQAFSQSFSQPSTEQPPTEDERVARVVDHVHGVLVRVKRLLAAGDRERAAYDMLEVRAAISAPAAARALATHLWQLLLTEVEWAWANGWEPADLMRSADREVPSGSAALVRDAIAGSLSRYAAATVAPRWWDQLRSAEVSCWWAVSEIPVQARAARTRVHLAEVLLDAVGAHDYLAVLPALSPIEARPGQWRPRPQADQDAPQADDRTLERIRAMLAKAESTPYEAEADTFMAAAQTLMTRHSIDRAMLNERRRGPASPISRRVGVERPYELPKVHLLDVVASANRCRTVWSKHLGFVTVVGFESDITATETLFTSLLVQSARAMHDPQHAARRSAAPRAGRGAALGAARTRSYRQSFLVAFAHRIGQRLRQAAQEAIDGAIAEAAGSGGSGPGAGSGRELVRVLADRDAKVDETVTELFPQLTQRSAAAAHDLAGWSAGVQAADRATLFEALPQ